MSKFSENIEKEIVNISFKSFVTNYYSEMVYIFIENQFSYLGYIFLNK